jgi:PAS domain S-box-containing protein
LNQLESTVRDAETVQRLFVITGDEAYLWPFNQASDRLESELEAVQNFDWIDILPEEITSVTQLAKQRVDDLLSTVDLRRTKGFDAAIPVIRSGAGKQLMDRLRSDMARLREREVAALKIDEFVNDNNNRIRTRVFVLCGILNIGILAWGYRRISEALKQRDLALERESQRGFELRQQKDLLNVTLSSIGDCVMVADNEGKITFINPVAEQVTGWKLAEAMTRPTSDVFRIVNEESREPVENPVARVMREGVIVGLADHTLLVQQNGSDIPIDYSAAPIRDASGGIQGVVLAFRDYSQRKQNERELLVAKEAAETANKAKDQFLAMLSHELRTPLTPVLATLNLWEASEDVPQSLRADVQMLRRSIELEARIIDDLLDLTRIARGLLSFSPENTDVHGVLEFLVGLSQTEFEDKELKVTLKLHAARHHVQTDAARLQQVLWNILRNAIKFTEQGGAIAIATSNDTRGQIVIQVTDTGIGMTPETLSKLFVPFEQADPTRNRRYGGLGLGMAISNALVNLLDGQLDAESAGLGKGSNFKVQFPTADPATERREPEHIPRRTRERVRLLLVEDHLDTARALSRLLQSRGYKIETVATVEAGIEAAQRNSFDLLLCDLGLPDGSGIDLIRKIRMKGKTPAIALTGFGMQEDVEQASRAGFNAHLTKPVNLQKLEVTIWRLLQEK